MMRYAIAALSFLVACCATPYQQNDPFWGGVSATPVGTDTWRIESELNAFSGPSTVHDYLMLRAAETAIAQGAVGFQMLGTQDTSVNAGQGMVRPGGVMVVRLVREPVPTGTDFVRASDIIDVVGRRVRH